MEEFFGQLKNAEGRKILKCLYKTAHKLMPPPEVTVYKDEAKEALGTYERKERAVFMHMPGLKRATAAMLPWDPKPTKEEALKATYGVMAYCLCHELAHAAYYTLDVDPPTFASWDELDGPILQADVAHRLALIRGSEEAWMPCRPAKDNSEYEIKIGRRERYLAGDEKAIQEVYGPKLAGKASPEVITKNLAHFGAGEFIAHIGSLTTMLMAAPEIAKTGPMGREMAKDILAMGKGITNALEAMPDGEQRHLRATMDGIHRRLGWTTPPSAVIGNRNYLTDLEQTLALEEPELAM